MRAKISKQTVDRLGPGSLIWDTVLIGFGVRRQLRHPFYLCRYRIGGKQRFLTIGPHGQWTPETARRECQRLLGIVASGVDPAAKAKGDDRFSATTECYLARQQTKLKPRSFVEVQRHLRKHSAPLANLILTAITRRDVAQVLADVEQDCGAVSRNRVRASLSSLWTWAVQEGLVEHNIVTGTGRADEGPSRDRVLSNDELRKVWRSFGDDDFSLCLRLLLLTGQRKSEISELVWNEVNLKDAVIVLPAERTKNGREHTLPLSGQALALLARRKRNGEFVFGIKHWVLPKERLDQRAQIQPWRLHDLRRSCATGMAELGVQPWIIEAVLNHVSGHKSGVAGIYNRAKYADEMREALQRWANHVDQITRT
ncbi:MAG: site-specific integrase [Xanthobacteraceae bacterium]